MGLTSSSSKMGNCKNSTYAAAVDQLQHISMIPIHSGSVLSIIAQSSYEVITSSDDNTIARSEIGNMFSSDYQPLYFSGHTKAVNRLAFSDGDIWSVSRDLTVRQVFYLFS